MTFQCKLTTPIMSEPPDTSPASHTYISTSVHSVNHIPKTPLDSVGATEAISHVTVRGHSQKPRGEVPPLSSDILIVHPPNSPQRSPEHRSSPPPHRPAPQIRVSKKVGSEDAPSNSPEEDSFDSPFLAPTNIPYPDVTKAPSTAARPVVAPLESEGGLGWRLVRWLRLHLAQTGKRICLPLIEHLTMRSPVQNPYPRKSVTA